MPVHLRALACALGAASLAAPGGAAAPPDPIPLPTLEAQAFEPDPLASETLDRETLIAAVLERNPGLEAARQAWRAARQRPARVATLDDPMVSYSVGPLTIADDDTRFGQVLAFSQRVPYPGKLRLRGELARADAEVAALELEALRLELALEASLLHDELYVVDRALEINREHMDLLEDFRRIATARYAAGLVAQQAPLQAEVELTHLIHRETVLETARRALEARLNALLHQPPGTPLPPPPAALPPPAPAAIEPAVAEAMAARPELARLDARIEGRELAVELARLERRPDFEGMASYNSMWGAPEHRLMVGLSLNLPLRRARIDAGVAEAEARLAEAESERRRLADAIGAEVDEALARLEEARHVVELYRDLILPASNDQVRAALAGFRTGASSFLALIEAERNLRTVKLESETAAATVYRRRAELDRALGRPPLSDPAEDPVRQGDPS